MTAQFDPRQPLYKYLKREHAQSMREHGLVRIGTLYDFRSVEEYGGAVAEVYEGRATVYHHIDQAYGEDVLKDPEFGPLFKVKGDRSGMTISVSNGSISRPVDSPNYYIYCVTASPSEGGLQEFGNDVCVRISDPHRFGELVTKSMLELGLATHGIVAPCIYAPRTRSTNDENLHPAFLKSIEFSYQVEVRFLWTPASKQIYPQCILCPAIRDLLTVVDIPPSAVPLPPRRHAHRFSDDDVLRRTFALVDDIVERLALSKDAHEALRNHARTHFQPPAADLLREYANRGLRDARLESLMVDSLLAGSSVSMLAYTLQRLAELFEIRRANEAQRNNLQPPPMRLETESTYRFWASFPGARREMSAKVAAAARERILRARDEEREILPTASDSDYSVSRGDYYFLSLDVDARRALAWLARKGKTPPSEVLDELFGQPRVTVASGLPRSDGCRALALRLAQQAPL